METRHKSLMYEIDTQLAVMQKISKIDKKKIGETFRNQKKIG